MPKAPKSPGAAVQQRHNPLAEEYAPSDPWKSKPAKRQKRNKEEKEDDKFVDSKSSRKILDIGRELEEEDERENRPKRQEGANAAFDFESRMGEDDLVADEEEVAHIEDDDEAWGEDDEEVEEVEIDANDLAAWNKFIPTDDNPIVWPGEEAQPQGPGTDLAALILEKIAAHEATDGAVKQPQILGGGDPEDAVELPAKVVEGRSIQFLHLHHMLISIQSTQKLAL
jgi:essential nuclear protein 1